MRSREEHTRAVSSRMGFAHGVGQEETKRRVHTFDLPLISPVVVMEVEDEVCIAIVVPPGVGAACKGARQPWH